LLFEGWGVGESHRGSKSQKKTLIDGVLGIGKHPVLAHDIQTNAFKWDLIPHITLFIE
jgi:hypothetical protein